MTLSQLEKYMISEIENLHIKMDEGFSALSTQIQGLVTQMTRVLDRLDDHNNRIQVLEKK